MERSRPPRGETTPTSPLVKPLEGIALLTPLDALVAELDQRGWKHNTRPLNVPDQRVTVFPTSGAKRIDVIVEKLIVIGIAVTYPDSVPSRRDAFSSLALHNEDPDGWYAGDKAHQVLAFVSRDGTQVRLLATGRMRDQREVAAMFHTFLRDPP
jgi:hypothetical protein